MLGGKRERMRTKYYFKIPTRAEWRKFHFKKDDGVLKSLEYLVHTTIIEPTLEEYKREIEPANFNLTEQLGERLANILTCLDITEDAGNKRIEVDPTKPILPNQLNLTNKPSIGDDFECLVKEIVYEVLKKHSLIGVN